MVTIPEWEHEAKNGSTGEANVRNGVCLAEILIQERGGPISRSHRSTHALWSCLARFQSTAVAGVSTEKQPAEPMVKLFPPPG